MSLHRDPEAAKSKTKSDAVGAILFAVSMSVAVALADVASASQLRLELSEQGDKAGNGRGLVETGISLGTPGSIEDLLITPNRHSG